MLKLLTAAIVALQLGTGVALAAGSASPDELAVPAPAMFTLGDLQPVFTIDRVYHVDRLARTTMRGFKRITLLDAARGKFAADVARRYDEARGRRLHATNTQLRLENTRLRYELRRLRR